VIPTASLALATLAFVGTHFLMSHPLRLGLIRNMGESGFRIAYSLVAIVTLGWMILAFPRADAVPLWIAPGWCWIVGSLVMLLGSILLVGSFVRNPAFPNPGSEKQASRPATGVFAITRHPMNWSFILWALVHMSVWGSPRNLIVALGILVLALFGSIGQDRKKLSAMGESWRGWQSRTSFVPFGALIGRKVKWRAANPGWIALGGGLIFWLAVTGFHMPLASPFGWFARGAG
jgi:uncharacterized membrane protein